MASLATRSRPFRYATVKPIKNDFYNLKSIAAPSASSHSVAASAIWIALPWNKGGVLPVPIDRSLWKAINDPPGISAHSGELTDLAFSPFNDYLLATAGSEGIVKIWELPKDCYNLPSAISSSTIKIEGGLESVSTIKWHPSAEGIIAVGYKNGINIYNVSSQETASSPLYSFKIEGFGRDIVSIAWSYDGSLIAIITKNGLVAVFDPRSAPSNILSTAYAPPSMKKPQHALFVSEGAGERLVLSGLTASHRPLVQFYDVRPSIPTSSTTPVFTQDLDFSQGYSLPLYDRDTGMLFFTIRGSNVVAVFDIEPEKVAVGPPKQIMVPCHSASCDDVFKGACLINKRAVNSNAAEIQRLVLLGAEAIQPYSISVPRKVGGFHEELYPATNDIVAALTADQWKAGENKDPVKISMAIINARGPSPSPSSGGNSSASAPSSSPTASSSSSSASFEKKEDKPIAAKYDGGRVSPAPAAAAAPVYAASAARKNLEAKLKKSPFTHTSMKEPQYKQYTFFDIKIGQTIALAENLQCNEKYFAFPWKTLAGSAIAVFPVNQVGRAETSTPAIRGHSTPATAFDLSIQDPSLIGTGSADGQVRIWRIPEEGVKKDLLDGQEESKFIVAGKVQLIKFHPFIPDLLITAAAAPETGKHTIEIWDLRIKNPSNPRLSYSNIHSDFIIDISFHPHGHRIATASKDGRIRVIDLGTGNVISQFTAVESIRDTRAVFTSPNRIVTTGFGSGSIRSISVWDVSGSEGKKLAQREIDRNSNTPVPRYDEDTGLLYVGNGGGSFLHLFEIKNEEPFVELLNVFESPNEAMGFSLMPKKKCDVKTVEVAKGFKLGKDAVFPLTFTLARKRLEFFQDDVYPDSRDLSTPILSIDDLLSGTTVDGNSSYKKLSLQPSGMKKLSEAPPEEMTESQKKYQEAMKLRNAPKAKGVLGHTSAEEVKEHFRGVAANYSGRNRFDAVQDKAADVDEDEWA